MDIEFLPRFRPLRDEALRPACLIWDYMVGEMCYNWWIGGKGDFVPRSLVPPGLSPSLSVPSFLSLSYASSPRICLLPATCPSSRLLFSCSKCGSPLLCVNCLPFNRRPPPCLGASHVLHLSVVEGHVSWVLAGEGQRTISFPTRRL